jgi:hypothetical protein
MSKSEVNHYYHQYPTIVYFFFYKDMICMAVLKAINKGPAISIMISMDITLNN